MAITVLQHHDIGRPGRLGVTLRDHGHTLDIRRLDAGDPIPPDYDNADGLIVMGGPQSVNDDASTTPWMEREHEYIRGAHERELPVVGICLGCQGIAKALGGAVQKMDTPEIGFIDIDINPLGQTDPVLAGVAWSAGWFSHHGEEIVELPPGAAPLASSKRCKIQAFRAGLRTYAFQFHFEADRPKIDELTRSLPDQLHSAGVMESDIDKQLDERYVAFARLADRLCVNIAALLMPVDKRVTA